MSFQRNPRTLLQCYANERSEDFQHDPLYRVSLSSCNGSLSRWNSISISDGRTLASMWWYPLQSTLMRSAILVEINNKFETE